MDRPFETPRHDPLALREAFGAFMTGVTIVTALGEEGPVGLTANSFTSVSLDPPLLLVCVAKASSSLPTIHASGGFAVNILEESQIELSNRFARPAANRYDGVAWRRGPGGSPILEGVCGWFDCRVSEEVSAGDHVVLLGRVEAFDHPGGAPLGYARGGYFSLDRKA